MKENLRIIWAITAKDLVAALKNRNSLINIVLVLLIMLFFREYDNLMHGDDPPNLLIYDAGGSSLVAQLEESPALDLYRYDSAARLDEMMGAGDAREMGVIIPAGFDQMVASGQPLTLEGYVVQWVSDADARALQAEFEREIGRLVGRPVAIHLDGNRVMVRPDAGGPITMAALTVVYVLLMTGIGVVPTLMIEEKSDKTIDALLVSPARSSHLTIAKALTGLFYVLAIIAVTYLVHAGFINHWQVAVPLALAGALFCVALGLLFGTLFDSRQQLSLWGFIAAAVLFLPVVFSTLGDIMPAAVMAVVGWIPTTALVQVFWVACSAAAPLADYGWRLAYLTGWALALLAAVAWLVRRSDR